MVEDNCPVRRKLSKRFRLKITLQNHYPQPAVFRTVRRPGARSALSHPASGIPQSVAAGLPRRTPQRRRSTTPIAQTRVARPTARHERRACPPSPRPRAASTSLHHLAGHRNGFCYFSAEPMEGCSRLKVFAARKT
jgi:hypothetical protein